MLQRLLVESVWLASVTTDDLRGLTPVESAGIVAGAGTPAREPRPAENRHAVVRGRLQVRRPASPSYGVLRLTGLEITTRVQS